MPPESLGAATVIAGVLRVAVMFLLIAAGVAKFRESRFETP